MLRVAMDSDCTIKDLFTQHLGGHKRQARARGSRWTRRGWKSKGQRSCPWWTSTWTCPPPCTRWASASSRLSSPCSPNGWRTWSLPCTAGSRSCAATKNVTFWVTIKTLNSDDHETGTTEGTIPLPRCERSGWCVCSASVKAFSKTICNRP